MEKEVVVCFVSPEMRIFRRKIVVETPFKIRQGMEFELRVSDKTFNFVVERFGITERFPENFMSWIFLILKNKKEIVPFCNAADGDENWKKTKMLERHAVRRLFASCFVLVYKL